MCVLMSCVSGWKCTSDEQCQRIAPNTYCYVSGKCAPCEDCEVYRRSTGIKLCARERDDCGTCLPGHNAEMNIDGTLGACVPNTSAPTKDDTELATPPPDVRDTSNQTSSMDHLMQYIIPSLIFALLVLGIFLIRQNDRCSSYIRCRHTPQSSVHEYPTTKIPSAPYFDMPTMGPPPYSLPLPPSPPDATTSDVETQQANPWLSPIYVRHGK